MGFYNNTYKLLYYVILADFVGFYHEVTLLCIYVKLVIVQRFNERLRALFGV